MEFAGVALISLNLSMNKGLEAMEKKTLEILLFCLYRAFCYLKDSNKDSLSFSCSIE